MKSKNGQNLNPANLFNQTPLLKKIIFAVGIVTALWAGIQAFLINSSDYQVTLTSSNLFLVDNNKGCDIEPHAAYIAFEICNLSGVDQTNLTASIGNFTDANFGLAGNQAADQTIDLLEADTCQTIFWYVYYDCSDDSMTTDITFSLSDSTGDFFSQTESFVTRSTIDAGAGGKTGTANLIATSSNGNIISFDCQYIFGLINTGTPIVFQPAGNLDFKADCFQLIGSEVTYSNIPGVPLGSKDQLYFADAGKVTGNPNEAYITYYFRLEGCSNTDTTRIKAYSALISGQNYKRYNLSGQTLGPVLPINWHWIKTDWINSNGQIIWEASGIIEGESFTIERSQDGVIFELLGSHDPAELALQMTDQYAFTDKNAGELAESGMYYRIKHTDIDGKASYSNVVELKAAELSMGLHIFPNPARDFTQINCTNLQGNSLKMRVLNQAGAELYQSVHEVRNHFEHRLDISQWPAAQYFVEIQNGENREVKSLIKR